MTDYDNLLVEMIKESTIQKHVVDLRVYYLSVHHDGGWEVFWYDTGLGRFTLVPVEDYLKEGLLRWSGR